MAVGLLVFSKLTLCVAEPENLVDSSILLQARKKAHALSAAAVNTTYDVGTFKGTGDEPGDICPYGKSPMLSDLDECKAWALALGKTWRGETLLANYTPGCSERINSTRWTGVWFNTNLTTKYEGHRMNGKTAPVCKILPTDWPAAWPPADGEMAQGPWPKRGFNTTTQHLEAYTDENKKHAAPMFADRPLIGSVMLPAGPRQGELVPFPHTVQDAEGIGLVGTADASKVEAIVPKPWKPVLTTDGRATWATWKDVERVNFLGQVCQRQWVAFYVQHPDHSFPAVESPFQLLFGQFAGFHYYSYTHQMYTDCDLMVEIDRNMYGWDSHLSEHNYNRDIHGNLVWNVTSGGEKIMDAKVYMPYGSAQLMSYFEQLQKYGFPPLSQSTDQFWKFLKMRNLPFMWLSKPGVMPIQGSANLTPVIYSPFGFFDTQTYPSTNPGEQWDTDKFFEEAYYDENGPFSLKTPFEESDSVTWFGEFAEFDMQNSKEFSLVFHTHHFRMLWDSPWTFTRVTQ